MNLNVIWMKILVWPLLQLAGNKVLLVGAYVNKNKNNKMYYVQEKKELKNKEERERKSPKVTILKNLTRLRVGQLLQAWNKDIESQLRVDRLEVEVSDQTFLSKHPCELEVDLKEGPGFLWRWLTRTRPLDHWDCNFRPLQRTRTETKANCLTAPMKNNQNLRLVRLF